MLKKKLKELKITNRDLAIALDVSTTTVSLWLNCRRRPTDDKKLKIIEYTNGYISHEDFFHTHQSHYTLTKS